MKTDIEIAQETKLIPINELAHSAGLADSEFELVSSSLTMEDVCSSSAVERPLWRQ